MLCFFAVHLLINGAVPPGNSGNDLESFCQKMEATNEWALETTLVPLVPGIVEASSLTTSAFGESTQLRFSWRVSEIDVREVALKQNLQVTQRYCLASASYKATRVSDAKGSSLILQLGEKPVSDGGQSPTYEYRLGPTTSDQVIRLFLAEAVLKETGKNARTWYTGIIQPVVFVRRAEKQAAPPRKIATEPIPLSSFAPAITNVSVLPSLGLPKAIRIHRLECPKNQHGLSALDEPVEGVIDYQWVLCQPQPYVVLPRSALLSSVTVWSELELDQTKNFTIDGPGGKVSIPFAGLRKGSGDKFVFDFSQKKSAVALMVQVAGFLRYARKDEATTQWWWSPRFRPTYVTLLLP